MNKKSLIGYAPWGAAAALFIGFGLHTYFSAPPKYQYTKPKEIISELVKERKENSDLERQVKEHIKNLNNQMDNRLVIDNLFLYECDLSQEQREQYITEIQKQKPVLEFEYLSKQNDNLVIGITVNGKPTYLYGKAYSLIFQKELHFKCDF
ncbi:hypothetical protein J4404_01005 [Candidatus Woesearchaeota archaeon]|nr:hypothetical protein [Candidatus Woesearchaeota archaeon]